LKALADFIVALKADYPVLFDAVKFIMAITGAIGIVRAWQRSRYRDLEASIAGLTRQLDELQRKQTGWQASLKRAPERLRRLREATAQLESLNADAAMAQSAKERRDANYELTGHAMQSWFDLNAPVIAKALQHLADWHRQLCASQTGGSQISSSAEAKQQAASFERLASLYGARPAPDMANSTARQDRGAPGP